MQNFTKFLASRGIRKGWFVKNKLGIPISTFDYFIKENKLPQHIIDILLKELNITYEQLRELTKG